MSGAAISPVADGLPGPLPEGEHVLWQGAPARAAILRGALHPRLLAAYFGASALLTLGTGWSQGRSLGALALAFLPTIGAAMAVFGALWLLAHLVARTTRYTLTNRRVVMRIGIALPLTLNIPFAIVQSAGLRLDADGSGDIPLTLTGRGRIGYLNLWPHVRPWKVSRPEPMLRGVPEAAQVAAILARALGSGALGRAAAIRDEARRETTDPVAATTAAATAAAATAAA